jgi:hypothetical protein
MRRIGQMVNGRNFFEGRPRSAFWNESKGAASSLSPIEVFLPTRESTAASKTRETRSWQTPHAISTDSLMLQCDSRAS